LLSSVPQREFFSADGLGLGTAEEIRKSRKTRAGGRQPELDDAVPEDGFVVAWVVYEVAPVGPARPDDRLTSRVACGLIVIGGWRAEGGV
jgi:hypothetical protein